MERHTQRAALMVATAAAVRPGLTGASFSIALQCLADAAVAVECAVALPTRASGSWAGLDTVSIPQ